MRERRIRSGRPLGEIGIATLQLAWRAPVSARGLAAELQISRVAAYRAVENLTRAGYLQPCSGAATPTYTVAGAGAERAAVSMLELWPRR